MIIEVDVLSLERIIAMMKLFLPLLLLVLLALACGGGGGGVWQPASSIPPQFAAPPPQFLIEHQDTTVWPPRNLLISLDVTTGTTETQELTGTGSLATLLADEYRVVDSVLISQQNQIYTILGGRAAPNGLWTAQQRDEGLALRRVDDAGMLTLSSSGRSPVWSPDSQWLAYQDDTGLWAVLMTDLSIRLLLTASVEPLAWSADNSQLLLRDEQTVTILDVAAQSQRPLNDVDGDQIHGQPVWSPDGQVIYARYGDNGRLDLNSAHNQPDDIMARLVAMQTGGGRTPIRDLLPTVLDQGIMALWLSPDGEALVVHHFHCVSDRSGLIPLLSVRNCAGKVVVVAANTGNYATIWQPPLSALGGAGWERLLPAIDLSDLPLPPEPIPSVILPDASIAPDGKAAPPA